MPPSAPQSAQNYVENGRFYHAFRKGKYMFPCDEAEMDRMDIYHKFFAVARRGHLHNVTLTKNIHGGPRILDLGCGTGIWAIDVAETHFKDHAEVHGVDLSMIQPGLIPENVGFSQRDIESPWYGMDVDWDLIHMRMLNGSISSWPDIYSKIFRHLKPGFGWLEHVEIDMYPRCDDGTLPQDSHLVQWADYLLEATARAQRPLAYNTQTRAMLESAGFVEIQEQVIKVPLNPWPADPHMKDVGRWYNLGLTQGLEALSLGPLTRVNHWPVEDIERLIAAAKRDICSKRYHSYCNM
ncbi:S-adenosyl-L-methionine-dependent methyltransferase [Mollisia scopiformis]|uniref:S-adenosyl-L-methionine-dependent methyltransferase n=1 Tax=Mollisia scopiformis TaxID=149040 RepID=A0A132B8N3_MOLSC|nr:S-adenosyl-L-methionine-dependent methyltransferase [Mollisia scopiformis]KUJ08731.1 S-adenosyl-L-methionine-dependent methyltransferase [Mollisia scopiformis]